MDSRERVLAALEGRIPDRVPIGEYAIGYDLIEKIIGHPTYLCAGAKSQIAFWEGRRDEVADSLIADHIELHEKLDLDIVSFPPGAWSIPPVTDDLPPRRVDDTTWQDKYGRVWQYVESTAEIACVRDPVAEKKAFSVSEFWVESTLPVADERSWQVLDAVIQRFKDVKFICGPSGGEIGIVMLGGVARGSKMLREQPEVVRAATAFMLRRQNLADDVLIHPDADGVLWGADLGRDRGPLVDLETFRTFFLQANRARARNVHEKYGKRILKHCCGDVEGMMDLFVEMGYDAYHVLDSSAGADLCTLKKRYGAQITLWGGVPHEHLVSGTPEQVRQDVRHAVACAKPGGRFILGSSQTPSLGIQYDNFMAMLDEHQRQSAYS